MNYLYSHVVLGGTFDILHIGHQGFLIKAFKLGKFVTIGLTTDKFNKLRGKPAFQNQNLRLKNLKLFLTKENYIKRSKIIFINNVFGTTLTDPALQAIIVTSKTKGVVDLINKKRVGKNLNKLDIITVPFTKDKNSQIISSTRIRESEINTLGQSYKSMLLKIAGKKLTEAVRKQLKKPLGPLISPINLPNLPHFPNLPYIAIGDITTANFLKAGLLPSLAVVDGKVGRRKVLMDPRPDGSGSRYNRDFRGDDNRVVVKNPPGQISKSLILAVDQAIRKFQISNFKFQIILVSGEEDLATIPAILLSPLGTTVFYGQPKKGMVEVKVDLEIKDKLIHILF